MLICMGILCIFVIFDNNIVQTYEKSAQKKYICHKEVAKPTLFQQQQEDQLDVVPVSVPSTVISHKIQKDIYDAAKIQENQLYYGNHANKKSNGNDQGKGSGDGEGESKKKRKAKLNKNLFESQSESDEEIEAIEQGEQGEDIVEDVEQRVYGQQLQKYNKEQEQKLKQNSKNNMKAPLQIKQEHSPTKFSSYSNRSQKSEQNEHIEKVNKILEQTPKSTLSVSSSFLTLLQGTSNNRQDIKKLIYNPIPKQCKAICTFKRVPSGFSESFQLLLENNQPLFFCENQRGSIGANYYISLTKEMDKKSSAYLGKLRGNSISSVYQLYDHGAQPDKKSDRSGWRVSMACIQYEDNFMGMNGPRKLKVTLPRIEGAEDFDSYRLGEGEQLNKFEAPVIKNKQPRWNQRLKSYALNFGGRVKQASIKNFILVDDEISSQQQMKGENTLVFGKIEENTFNLQVSYPISIYQAFGIVISQFDFKMNCE